MNILGIDFEDWFHPELIQKAEFKVEKEPKVIVVEDNDSSEADSSKAQLPT